MYRIMIVDDEIRSVELLRKYIEGYMPDFYVSGTYTNGKDALDAFLKKPVDIALVDIEMPVMDGLSLICELNRLSANYVPIILSSYETFEYARTAMKNGVEHYLSKPIDFDEVRLSLNAAAEKLQFRKLLREDIRINDESGEEYFLAMLDGQFLDYTEAVQQFSGLDLPFSYGQCRCSYFQLRLENAEQWGYGNPALFHAIANLLRTVYAPVYLAQIHQKQDKCSFMMVSGEFPDRDLSEFIDQGKKLLKVWLSIAHMQQFDSLEQLRRKYLPWEKSETAASETEDYISHKADIEKVISYIQLHYGEDLSRSDLAKMLYMSDAYFSRCFKAITQKTFKNYLTGIRMEKAIELLGSDVKVQEVARAVGYENHTRFSVVFRQYTSYTPSEYRTIVLKRL